MAPIKILHLEDSSSDADLVGFQLKKSNIPFERIIVDSKTEYIQGITDFLPDIILSDHSLPSFNSEEALNLLKETGSNIPFILVTATVSEEFAVKMMKAGITDYILKDRLQRLPGAIINAIDKYRLEIEKNNFIQKVIANEELFKEAELIAHFGLWKFDLVAKTSSWSEETYRILGYEPGEVIPSLKNFLRNINTQDIPMVENAINNLSNDPASISLNFSINTKNHSKRFIKTKFKIKKDENGKLLSLLGFLQDITEQKFAEELLYQSEANLRAILDNTDRAYILFDPGFKVVSYNSKAESFILGQFDKQLSASTQYAHDFSISAIPEIIEIIESVKNGKTVSYEKSYNQKDNTVKWFHIQCINLLNIQNERLGIIMSALEITERKMAETEREQITSDLIQRNKELEQFTYIVSHNLRAPLANIIGLTQNLKNLNASQQEKNYILDLLDLSTNKLDTIIRDLNDILQVKQTLNVKMESVSFTQLAEDIKYADEIAKANKNVIFKFNFTEVDQVFSLKSYLYSIFFNLISNSIKYKQADQPAIIEITSRRIENKIELTFKDNGLGIDMDKRKTQVFGLYKRFHLDIEGKGIGLFMVKTEVEALGGSITVQSEVNNGTTFTILLPD